MTQSSGFAPGSAMEPYPMMLTAAGIAVWPHPGGPLREDQLATDSQAAWWADAVRGWFEWVMGRGDGPEVVEGAEGIVANLLETRAYLLLRLDAILSLLPADRVGQTDAERLIRSIVVDVHEKLGHSPEDA